MKIFYDGKMVADTRSFSLGGTRPKRIADRIKELQIGVEFHSVDPLSWEDFYLSHSREYVEGIRTLTINNGFGNRDASVRDALPYTSGYLFCAAKAALQEKVAWAMGSGFHHAHRTKGDGFCTFDGITVSAKKLLNLGFIQKAFIIDSDFHLGDGCLDCITEEWMEKIAYWHLGGRWESEERIRKRIKKEKPDIIFYHEGMDAYHYDPLGGRSSPDLGLSYQLLYQRTRMICTIARENKIPFVISPGGGYLRWPPLSDEFAPSLLGFINSVLASLEVFEPQASFGLAKVELGPQPWENFPLFVEEDDG